jgi:hypothetical protein
MTATAKGISSDTLVSESNPTCFSASRFHGKSVNGTRKYDIKTTTFLQFLKREIKLSFKIYHQSHPQIICRKVHKAISTAKNSIS